MTRSLNKSNQGNRFCVLRKAAISPDAEAIECY